MARKEELQAHDPQAVTARGNEAVRYLAKEHLDAPTLNALPTWLSYRTALLPLLGMRRSFLRTVLRMSPADQQEYLRALPGELLDDSTEREQWQALVDRQHELAREMVLFWRLRHGL